MVYDTITVSAGETHYKTISGGETWEHELIDVSATGANLAVRCSGTNWTIRNIGVRGRIDVDKNESSNNNNGVWPLILANGSGTIEHCYFGDGVEHTGLNRGALGVSSSANGSVTIRDCHFAEWSDNAAYMANSTGQTATVENSYFRDNNVAHLRMGAGGSRAVGCIVHNTGNVPPVNGSDYDSKGVYSTYGDGTQQIDVTGCHFDLTNTNGSATVFETRHGQMDQTEIVVSETEFAPAGSTRGNVTLASGNGNNPVIEIPQHVPETAEKAANGGESRTLSDVLNLEGENEIRFRDGRI